MMSNQHQLSMKSMELRQSPFEDLLVSPYEVDYGTDKKLQDGIAYKNIEIRLGDRPLCRNLRRLYEQEHKDLPADIAVFDAYDIWMLTHSINAIDRKGDSAKITALGYEADFKESEYVYTIELLPQTKFVSPLEGSFTNKADLLLEGNAKVPDAIKTATGAMNPLGGDARINLSSELKVIGKVEFAVKTSIIQAVGIGSSRCEWMFEKDKKPLLGDQIMLQTILVPRFTTSAQCNIRGYAMLKPNWISFPVKFYTDWIDIKLEFASSSA